MKTHLKIIYLFIIICLFQIKIYAQTSYIYIELIKTIPCKVWQNNEEVNMMNKSFVMLPVNDQREQNIKIEFGANLYPTQNFVIDAVPNAAFGYKLAKSGEQTFYLLDLINNGKIIESNSAINIGIATNENVINWGKDQPINTNAQSSEKSSWFRNIFSNNNENTAKKEIVISNTDANKNTTEPKYGVIEIIQAKDEKQTIKQIEKPIVKNTKQNNSQTQQIAVKNKNCAMVASKKEVEVFIIGMLQKRNDDDKMLMIRKKQFTGCLTSDQILHIGENLDTQREKFNLVRILIPNLADPQNIKVCESLFKNESNRNKFYSIIDGI